MALSKRFRRPLISLVVLLVMLPVGEVLVRILTDTVPPIVMRDPDLGRRFVPSFEGQFFDVESRRKIHVRISRDGFRGPDREPAPARDTRRMRSLS